MLEKKVFLIDIPPRSEEMDEKGHYPNHLISIYLQPQPFMETILGRSRHSCIHSVMQAVCMNVRGFENIHLCAGSCCFYITSTNSAKNEAIEIDRRTVTQIHQTESNEAQ